jgi:hypothetical protein
MNASLASLEEILPRIKVDGTNPFRTMVVKERWVKVHNEYVAYKREVSRRSISCEVLTQPIFYAD